jgi:hypothetical protein
LAPAARKSDVEAFGKGFMVGSDGELVWHAPNGEQAFKKLLLSFQRVLDNPEHAAHTLLIASD